mmetsp:Transcript_12173/g.23632  ORF Transcript_12173/g.23632 Transcript_12173/m.23632 type:complete len:374 (-) Transcript_12173:42-1163(-)
MVATGSRDLNVDWPSLRGDTWHAAGDQSQVTQTSNMEESELERCTSDISERATLVETVHQLQDGLSLLQTGHTRLVNVQVKTQEMQVQIAEYVEKRIQEHTEVWQKNIAEEIRRQLETATAALQQRITEQFEEQSAALQQKVTDAMPLGSAVLSEASKQKPTEELQRWSSSNAIATMNSRNAASSPQRVQPRTVSVRGAAAMEPDDRRRLRLGSGKVPPPAPVEKEERSLEMLDKLQSCMQRISEIEERLEPAAASFGVDQSSLAELERLERVVAGSLAAKSEASSPIAQVVSVGHDHGFWAQQPQEAPSGPARSGGLASRWPPAACGPAAAEQPLPGSLRARPGPVGSRGEEVKSARARVARLSCSGDRPAA